MNNLNNCFDLLRENEEKVYTEVCNVLSRLCKNVIDNPKELKYRKIRLGNPIIAEKILPAIGAMECLFEIGFVEKDDHLLLPENASLNKLQELQRLLSEPRIKKAEIIQPTQQRSPVIHPISRPSIQPSTSAVQTNSNGWNEETKFFNRIQGLFQSVLKYENSELQNKARNVVPLVDLQINAMEKMRLIQRDVKLNGDDDKSVADISIEDLLFTEVLRWFKEEFFKWVDSPDCTLCSAKCSLQRVIHSTNPGVSNIEIHRCGTCANIEKFPRYTDPAMLLHSRKGRCGEWSDAFALICRSLGYDTRCVWDYTDHVWVEIWSVAGNRWIHADPCENVMDRPLMYEKGWGKKLNYILAFSKDEIQDVTWRYTADQKAVMKRRKLCSEQNLLAFITSLTENRRRTNCSIPRQQFLVKRSLMELVELLSYHFGNLKENRNKKDDYEGRTSGSLAWRLARNETKEVSSLSHTWLIPSKIDSIKLIYSAASDEYLFVSKNEKLLQKMTSWEKGVYKMSGGIFRKVEHDWKMVYLARSSGNDSAKIDWSFELIDPNFEIQDLSLQATTAVFHGAIIEWGIEGFYRNGETKNISVTEARQFHTNRVKGAYKVVLTATLSGGDKDLAWQHAQLFRQSLDSKENSMEVLLNLTKLV